MDPQYCVAIFLAKRNIQTWIAEPDNLEKIMLIGWAPIFNLRTVWGKNKIWLEKPTTALVVYRECCIALYIVLLSYARYWCKFVSDNQKYVKYRMRTKTRELKFPKRRPKLIWRNFLLLSWTLGVYFFGVSRCLNCMLHQNIAKVFGEGQRQSHRTAMYSVLASACCVGLKPSCSRCCGVEKSTFVWLQPPLKKILSQRIHCPKRCILLLNCDSHQRSLVGGLRLA